MLGKFKLDSAQQIEHESLHESSAPGAGNSRPGAVVSGVGMSCDPKETPDLSSSEAKLDFVIQQNDWMIRNFQNIAVKLQEIEMSVQTDAAIAEFKSSLSVALSAFANEKTNSAAAMTLAAERDALKADNEALTAELAAAKAALDAAVAPAP